MGDKMRISDLQQKDIVNTKDGKKIGKISDVIVNEAGQVEYIVVASSGFFKRYTNFTGETNITFSQIVKFGKDVILVDLQN